MVRLALHGSVVRYYLGGGECGKIREKDGYPGYGADNGSFLFVEKRAVKADLLFLIRAPPFRFLANSKIGKESATDGRKRKILYCIGWKAFEVSRELYEAYYKGRRKEKYFTHDLKQEHTKVDKETGQITVIPSREDSYERLLAAEKQFAEEAVDIEDAAIRAVMLEKLNKALHTLTDEETVIIHALFYQEVSEVELAKRLGIPRTTLRSRKDKILNKLKKLL